MMADLRGAFFLFVSLTFFVLIIVFFALSMIMKPDRWSERARLTGEARSSGKTGLSTAA